MDAEAYEIKDYFFIKVEPYWNVNEAIKNFLDEAKDNKSRTILECKWV